MRFTDEASVEKRVLELIPECLQRAFDPATREGRALREKFAQRLPLAAVIAADFDRVAQSMKWANSTQKEHERSFDLLVGKLGRMPFAKSHKRHSPFICAREAILTIRLMVRSTR